MHEVTFGGSDRKLSEGPSHRFFLHSGGCKYLGKGEGEKRGRTSLRVFVMRIHVEWIILELGYSRNDPVQG